MAHRRKTQETARGSANPDLHGNAPDQSPVALLLVDIINDLNFPKNQELVRKSAALAQRIAALKNRCKQAGIPTIYVNDNNGRWRSDFGAVLKKCLSARSAGREMVKKVAPSAKDYLVLKPKHSAFYATPLQVLLEYIGVESVVLAGITTNACVMITASDIYIRDFHLFVPSDCVAALSDTEQRTALKLMENNYGADTTPSNQLDLRKLLRRKS